jgi:hypothetical protein
MPPAKFAGGILLSGDLSATAAYLRHTAKRALGNWSGWRCTMHRRVASDAARTLPAYQIGVPGKFA